MKVLFLIFLVLSVSCSHQVVITPNVYPVAKARDMFLSEQKTLFDFLPYSKIDKETLAALKIDKEIVVAVIDTGINCSDPIFKNRIWVPKELKKTMPCGINIINPKSSDMSDPANHGTKVASLILALHPKIKIFPIKAVVKGQVIDVANIFAASLVILKHQQHIKVVNLSIDGGEYSKLEESVMKDFNDAKISVVISSGNQGVEELEYPARLAPKYPAMVIVGGSSRQFIKPHRSADYHAEQVLVATVYEQYAVSNKGTIQKSYGTSFSAPVVSGVIALMRGINSELSPQAIKEILKDTAHKDKLFKNRNIASGELNIAAALIKSQEGKATRTIASQK